MKETQPLKLGCYIFYTCFRNLKKQNLAVLAPTFAGQGASLDQWSMRVWCKSDEALHPGNLTKSFDFFGKRKKSTQQLWSPWIEQLSLMKILVLCNDFWISSDRYVSGAISSRDASSQRNPMRCCPSFAINPCDHLLAHAHRYRNLRNTGRSWLKRYPPKPNMAMANPRVQ